MHSFMSIRAFDRSTDKAVPHQPTFCRIQISRHDESFNFGPQISTAHGTGRFTIPQVDPKGFPFNSFVFRSLLEMDPCKRRSAFDCLRHPYLSKFDYIPIRPATSWISNHIPQCPSPTFFPSYSRSKAKH